jgi:hypothetical protein
MNEIQIYSTIMFLAGAGLTKAAFYFEQEYRTKKFYVAMSAVILQILDSAYSCHKSATEYSALALKKIETEEELEVSEYLEKESNNVSVFMELYTLLLVKAIPEKGRKYVNYSTWPEASSLIEQIRGLTDDGKNQG